MAAADPSSTRHGAGVVTPPAPAHVDTGPIQIGGTVHVGHAIDNQPQAADYGGWTCWHLTGAEQPFQILPFDTNRHRAVISVTVPPATGLPAIGQGVVSAPTAGQTISSVALTDGAYIVSGAVELAGTSAAPADLNNFGFYIGSTLFLGMLTPPVAGLYTIPPSPVTIPLGGATLATKAVGNATAGRCTGPRSNVSRGPPAPKPSTWAPKRNASPKRGGSSCPAPSTSSKTTRRSGVWGTGSTR